MRQLMAILAACGIALGLTVGMAGPASAAAGDNLACRFTPAPTLTFTSPVCFNRTPANSYTVAFVVNATGTFTAAWSVPAGYPIIGGCTANATGCTITVSGIQDQSIPVSVTLTQGGVQETLSATASVLAVCGKMFC